MNIIETKKSAPYLMFLNVNAVYSKHAPIHCSAVAQSPLFAISTIKLPNAPITIKSGNIIFSIIIFLFPPSFLLQGCQ